MSIITTVALLVLLTIPEGISLGDPGMTRRCRCITKEKKPIGRYIGRVVVNSANSHCKDIEIIATLKKDGQQICLDPDAPWVKKVLGKRLVENLIENK
ncbi:interleukin-8-like isoform X1 [Seriola dumerili]|uniref:interleukin-8-like isoform X1 n=1 Tax=Seriola dumerili TaxID=41447 RepID=UPI000BBE4798|nr:interleukin-8-like isoform X1 [Seriola dumerili]XP_022614224.1 interleukin-8-like isoform X1 [Seriola dumerili]